MPDRRLSYATDEQAGLLLVRRLREMASDRLHVSVLATTRGFQANNVRGGNSAVVHIDADPIEALLVATGAVIHPNLRHRVEAQPADPFADLLG